MKIIFTIILLLLGSAPGAYACSCRNSTFDEAFKRTPLVVKATVIKLVGSDKIQLQFDAPWKGKAPREAVLKLVTGLSASCSPTGFIQPKIGTEYIFYIGQLKGDGSDVIHLGACGRSRLYKDLQEDAPLLEAYRQKLQMVDKAIIDSRSSKESKYQKVLFLREYGDDMNAEELLKLLVKEYPTYGDAWAQLASITYDRTAALRDYGVVDVLVDKRKSGYLEALKLAEKAIAEKAASKLASDVKQIALIQLDRIPEVDFKEANLSKRDIRYRVISNKELWKTFLVDTRFFGVDFTQVKIAGASFQNSRLMRVRFKDSSIISVRFDGMEWSDSARSSGDEAIQFINGGFETSQIKNSSFKKVRFRAPITNSVIEDSNFEESTFEGGFQDDQQTFMSNVTAKNSNFSKIVTYSQYTKLAELRESSFVDCNFSNAKIASKLTNVDFSKSNLSNIDLSGSSFDCDTKWPSGFNPVEHGAVPAEGSKCDNGVAAVPNFSGKDFGQFYQFGPINLENANFTNAKLSGARFSKVNLKGADFTNALLESADFQGANLENAKMRNLSLYGINFTGANLKNTDFTGADFSNARFGKSDNLDEANLTLARMRPDMKNLPDHFDMNKHRIAYWANRKNQGDPAPCEALNKPKLAMAGMDLTGVNLAYTCLRGANFEKAKLDKATLYNADLTGANLNGASFIGTKYSCDTIVPEQHKAILNTMVLIEVMGGCYRTGLMPPAPKLAGADLSGMNLWHGQLKGADLRNTNLTGTNLAGANLTNANLAGAKLKGATYNHGTKWPENFDYKSAGALEGGISGGNME